MTEPPMNPMNSMNSINSMNIPLCRPYLGPEEHMAAQRVLASGWLAHGPKNKEFEAMFTAYIGTKHATACNSCASALFLALKSITLTSDPTFDPTSDKQDKQDKQGEVILPSFTFAASANVIVQAGCTPVFAEINPETFNLDPADVEKKITEKTIAIMPVHYAGRIGEMDKIMALAQQHNLRVIEDSAETLGAELQGKKAGSFDIGCFSFYPTKNITTGEGGMITFNDDTLLDQLQALKAHGVVKPTFERDQQAKAWYRDAILPGYNFRMSDINAAIGIEQMKKLKLMNQLRRQHAQYLNKALTEAVGSHVVVPHVEDIKTHVYQMYVIKVKDATKRDALLEHLQAKGVGASIHFEPPVHLQQYYKTNFPTVLPITEQVCKQIITLPMFPALTQEELDYIVDTIKAFFSPKEGGTI